MTKSYYAEYLKETEAMFVKPREHSLNKRQGKDYYTVKEIPGQ